MILIFALGTDLDLTFLTDSLLDSLMLDLDESTALGRAPKEIRVDIDHVVVDVILAQEPDLEEGI